MQENLKELKEKVKVFLHEVWKSVRPKDETIENILTQGLELWADAKDTIVFVLRRLIQYIIPFIVAFVVAPTIIEAVIVIIGVAIFIETVYNVFKGRLY